MKITVIHILSLHKYPPVFSVLHALNELGHEVQLITTDNSEHTKKICANLNVSVVSLKTNYTDESNIITKFKEMFKIKKMVWDLIDNESNDEKVIWVFESSLKFMRKELTKKRYIVHFFELYDDLRFYKKIPFIKINLKGICRNALKVIHCESNRSFIAMAKLQLDKLPTTIPNKPYYNIEFKKKSEITTSQETQALLEMLKNKKIILYQGILNLERPLEEYIKAVEALGDEYAFVVLSGGEDIYKGLNSKNYYFIPFTSPPFHLEITSHAYIGVLSYFPTYKEISSPLNSLYCAPNKLYEYSMFGVPMIGNNIPGLSIPFEKYNCGCTVNEVKQEQIVEAINKIEENYSSMSANSHKLYASVDIKNIINKEVLNDLNLL